MASHFRLDWLKDPDYETWVREVKNNVNLAFCCVCKVNVSLSNMGKRALTSHSEGAKHQKNIAAVKGNSTIYFPPQKKLKVQTISKNTAEPTVGADVPEHIESDVCKANLNCEQKVKKKDAGIAPFLLKDSVSKAEIVWALKTISSHHSYRSNDNVAELFQLMFPDSDIASKFTMKKDKTSYTIVYGIAPYFKTKLTILVQNCEEFVLSFDESLNRVVQRGQMDILVRFWNNDVVPEEVSTRYFDSAFLGHATANDLLESFKECTKSLNLKSLLQVSMDGPNVNHAFLKALIEDIKDGPDGPIPVDIGSCGIHIVHGAFKTGYMATSSSIKKILSAMHRLYKDCPARRSDYINSTGCTKFPKKFCSVRWVENASVAGSALELFEHVEKHVAELAKSKRPLTSESFKTLKKAFENPLTRAQLGFFQSVAAQVEPFLTRFQDSQPLLPFLFDTLQTLIRSLMLRFIKTSLIPLDVSLKVLCEIDVQKSSNFCSYKETDIGFEARSSLAKSKVSDRLKMEFYTDCQHFLSAMVTKLLERNPLRYNLVRGASCLSPALIRTSPKLCQQRLKVALGVLLRSCRLSSVSADTVSREFEVFISKPDVLKEMNKFRSSETRLDHFYVKLLHGKSDLANLFKFVKCILIMSPGNAQVESGFSVNKEVLVENMTEKSVVAQRMVYDTVKAFGGVNKVPLEKQLILSTRNARALQLEDIKTKHKADQLVNENHAKNVFVKKELNLLESRRHALQEEMDSIIHSIGDLKRKV